MPRATRAATRVMVMARVRISATTRRLVRSYPTKFWWLYMGPKRVNSSYTASARPILFREPYPSYYGETSHTLFSSSFPLNRGWRSLYSISKFVGFVYFTASAPPLLLCCVCVFFCFCRRRQSRLPNQRKMNSAGGTTGEFRIYVRCVCVCVRVIFLPVDFQDMQCPC